MARLPKPVHAIFRPIQPGAAAGRFSPTKKADPDWGPPFAPALSSSNFSAAEAELGKNRHPRTDELLGRIAAGASKMQHLVNHLGAAGSGGFVHRFAFGLGGFAVRHIGNGDLGALARQRFRVMLLQEIDQLLAHLAAQVERSAGVGGAHQQRTSMVLSLASVTCRLTTCRPRAAMPDDLRGLGADRARSVRV